MQSTAVKTPVSKKRGIKAGENSSGKKLVQARLPFKIISSSATPSAGGSKESDTLEKEGRKRRLSFEAGEKSQTGQDEADEVLGRSASKENLTSVKKKKTTDEVEVILLDDDILEEDDDKKTEKNKVILKKQKKNVAETSANTTKSKSTKAKSAVISPHTPKTKEIKGKEADTPKGTNSKKSNTPASAKNKSCSLKARGSATKVQIKLPLGSAKSNKRRKSKLQAEYDDAELVISSDENEANPVKRPKVESSPKEQAEVSTEKTEKVVNTDSNKLSSSAIDESDNSEARKTSNIFILEIGVKETDVEDSELDSRCSSIIKETLSEDDNIQYSKDKTVGLHTVKQQPLLKETRESPIRPDNLRRQDPNNDPKKGEKNVRTSKKNELELNTANKKESAKKSTAPTNESNVLEVIACSSDSDISSSHKEDSMSHVEEIVLKITGTLKTAKGDANTELKKNVTPKQIKLIEQRRKAREEKERRLLEEKMQKQREKDARELVRKQEREEREVQRRKEREERDEQKRKEREEKDRKRLAEQEAKNEEKRKRNEAKEEELRKKEDERKRKEDADLKAKKEAEAFQKFFKAKRTSNGDCDAGQQQAHQDETLAFRPFEIKGDMKLAPIRRKQISPERRQQLDACVGARSAPLPTSHDLYLSELKSGKIKARKWRRISVETKASEDDIRIIDDDLDRAGLAIVEETHAPIEHFCAKFYKFHENRRPPYYGTWRKRTSVIKPRRPFMQDKKYFDYEIDSDLEWEEEEPGESLDGSDDEKEKESEDDDYEVDNEWFVPHGHLSDEELQNEDEVLDANTREAQKAKLQVLQQEFAQEMKKKTEKIKPRLIGCIWTDENGNQPALCPKIIWDTLKSRGMLFEGPPLLEDHEILEKSELGSPTANGNEKTVEKVKPIKITEPMLKDLVRLVHGNQHSKTFLIKEFIAFLEANEESIKNGEVRGPMKSIVREKIDDFAEWTITESIKASQNNKKKNKKRLCWVVSADALKKMELENLGLNNTWTYTLQPRTVKDETTKVAGETGTETPVKEIKEVIDDEEKEGEVEVKAKVVTVKNQSTSLLKTKKAQTNADVTKLTKLIPTKAAAQKPPKTTTTPPTNTNFKEQAVESNPLSKSITTATSAERASKAKKRVPLLMSVARGQQISQPTKNALISEFLKKASAEKEASSSKTAQAAEISEVVELD